jgi:hypothetical protein
MLQFPLVGTGADPGLHQQALATIPFNNTCEANAVSPEAAKMGVAGQRFLQPGEYQVDLIQQQGIIHISLTKLDIPCTIIDLI